MHPKHTHTQYTNTCVHAHTYTHLDTHKHTHTHTLAHTYVHKYTHKHTQHTNTYTHININTQKLHLLFTFCHRWAYRVYWPSFNGDSTDAVINDPNQFEGCGGNSVQDLHTIEFK